MYTFRELMDALCKYVEMLRASNTDNVNEVLAPQREARRTLSWTVVFKVCVYDVMYELLR